MFDNFQAKLIHIRDVTQRQELEEERNMKKNMEILTRTVSHDMLQPIHNIKFFADHMLTAGLNQDIEGMQKKYNMILESAQILDCRVKDLLDQHFIVNGQF